MATVVITGGTRGLGRALAETLAEAGWRCALIYQKDEAAAQEAASAVAGSIALRADVTDPAAVEAAVRRAAEGDRIEALVHCAFRSRKEAHKTHEVSVESWRQDLAVNLDGAFITAKAVLPYMLEAGRGRIVCIGSLAARGEAGRVAYATSKAGLEGFTKTLAAEYARHDITANVVHPGFLQTGAFLRLPSDIQERALRRVPSRRAGQALEVASLVRYLLGPDGGYVTGQTLTVDGGAR